MSGGMDSNTANSDNGVDNGGKDSARKKSRDAFRTISEVSKHLDLPQHVLRFWETKFPQVSPMKRGGGRRYYRPEDVVILSRIRALLHDEGYTIKGVQKLLKKPGAIVALEKEEKKSNGGLAVSENINTTPEQNTSQAETVHNVGHGDTASQNGIFNGGLSRNAAEKLLADLISVREGLKKFS